MEYIQAFKNYLLALRPTPSAITVKNYSLDVKHFVSWFESKYRQPFDPKAVTQDDIALFRREKNAELSLRSLDRHVSSLRKFFYFLKLQGAVSYSPLEKKTLSAEALAQADPFYFKQFKDFLYVYNAASLTIKNYIIDVKQFFRWAQETFPQEANLLGLLSGDLLAQYRDYLAGSGTFSPASINRKLSSLRKYVAWAKSQNLLENQSGLLSNPNEVANIPSTTASEMPKEERKAQSMNIEDSGPASQRGEQARMTTYSPFPPFRLAQKISKGINFAFDAIFIAPLALIALQGHRLLWTLKGKPLFTSQPWYQKIYFHARNTRPNWYKRYHSYALAHYFNWAILMIIMSIIGFGLYNTFVTKPQNSKPLLAATAPNRILSFQGRLTDSSNNPITTATNLRFGIYTDATSTGSALLWQEVDGVTPDSNGVFSVLLGKNSSIQQSLFANNANLYLGIAVGATAELTPREQLATVAFATNAETLQGLPPITQSGAGTSNVVLALNSSGNLSIGTASTFQTVGGAFTLSGDTLVLNTNSGTNGNITVAPDGQGFIDLQKPLINSTQNNNISSAQGSVEVDDTLAILATNSGIPAVTINQNGAGALFTASSGGVSEFTLGNSGTITSGHYQTAGGIFYADGTGLLFQTTAGSSGQCLQSNSGGTPTWGTCGGSSGTNFWTLDNANGVLYPINTTLDAFIGGTSTTSAKFSFLNVSSGTPTASVSSGLNGVGTYITANGTLQTTNFQGLTLGGTTTGNITIFGLGTGVVHSTAGVLSSSAVDLASSDVTGILPLNHGGTGANITGDQGGLVYFNSSTTLATLAHAATAGQCLLSGGTGTPTWANCSTASSNWWNVNQGALYPINDTFDLLLGGSGATTSAKFAVLNMTGSGTPTASVSSGLNGSATFITATGTLQTTNNQGLTLGGTTTGSISFANNINSNIIPAITDTYNLGSASLEWNNLYVKNIVSTGSIAGFWQRNLGVLAPTNITDDLAIGGVSTSAAKFQVFGLTGNATTAGTLTFTGGGSQIQTTSNQPLTLGGNSTGNIILEPNNGSGTVTSDGNIIPGQSDTYNLGSSTLEWNNIFAKNIFASGTYAGFFQRNSGVLSPTNITDDIAVGGTGTSSAKFQVFGNTGNATTTGTLTFNGNAVIAARNNTGLTIGDNQTGNITVFGLGTGVVHATSGVLSSGFVNLTSEVTGVLPIANGGTNTNSIAANGAIAYSNGTQYAFSAVGSAGQCLVSNGAGAPSWTSCSGASSNWWNMTNGTLYPINQTFDLTLGSSDGTGSTASAKFSVLNMTGSGTPTASVSSGLNGNGTYITANGTLQTTNFQGLTIGGTTTGNITLKPSNGIAGSSVNVFADLLPDATDTRNLGSSSLEWNNLYVKNIISSGSTAGFWQRILGVLSPANITDDLAIGGTGTSSAKFQVFGNTGNATTSGTLTFTNTGSQIQTTSNQPLTLGGDSTGGITLSPNNGSGIITLNGNVTENGTTFTIGNGSAGTIQTTSNANLTLTAGSGNIDFFSASNNLTSGGNLTLAGTITLPNSNTITGIANAIQLTQGLTVNSAGSSATHTNIDTSGNILPGTDLGANIGSNTLRWNNIFAGGNYDGFWQRFSGVVSPFNNTDDLAIGGTGTSSAKFQIFGLTGNATTSGNLTFNGNGQIQTTNDQTLTLGGNTTGNISFGSNVSSNILPYKTNTYDLGSAALQWNNIYAHNIFQDGQPITQVWQRNLGALSPLNITDDVLAGGTGTTSAKFAVLNMTGSGTPTASVSSGLNGVGTYITANGTLQTTSMQPLTVGGATTGPIQLSPKGTTGLFVDASGNVGIGTTSPVNPLTITGSFDFTGSAIGNTYQNRTSVNDARIQLATTGTTIDRNVADSNPALIIQQDNAGSTGDILQVKNNTITAVDVSQIGMVGIGTTSIGNGALVVNQTNTSGLGDIFSASASGQTKFTIQNDGTLIAKKYTTQNGVLYTSDTAGTVAQTAQGAAHTFLRGNGSSAPTFNAIDLTADVGSSILPIANGGTNANLTSELSNGGIVWSNATQLQILAASATAGQCLVSGGAATPSWTSCSGAASNWWNMNNGELFPINSTLDLILGSSDGTGSSASAKFAVLNMTGSGTPTASVSSGLNGSGTYITANGTLQTTNFQGLTIGGTTTGNITLEPLGSGTGSTINLNAKTIDDNQSTAILFGTPTALTIGNSSGTTTFASNIDSSKATLTLFATPTTINEGAVAQTFNVLGNFTAAALSADLVPTGNGSINLGSPSHYYGTVYAQNFIAPVSGGTSGFWQLTSNVLSPVNFWNDLAVGGNATGSATPFQVFATTVGVDTAGTATSSAGLSFRGTNTNIDLLNGSILNFKTSVGGDSGLSTVLTLANNGDLTQTGNFTTSGTLAVNGNAITTTNTGPFSLLNTSATNINFAQAVSGTLNIGKNTGTTDIASNLILGTDNTNTINANAEFISSLIPHATNTYDLGTNSLAWRNLYLSGNYGGFWQRFSGAVSLYNITDDLLIGTTATPSAAADTGFQIFGSGTNKATASTSGNLVFYGSAPTISTQKMLSLVLGSATTGPIQLSPKGTTGLYVDGTGNVGINTTNPTAVLDVAGAASVSGTLTFRTGLGTIQTTAMNTLTLGGNTTGNISFGSHISSDFIPFTTDTYNLGSAALEWNNLYVRQIITPSTGGIAGYWQLNNGVLSPANIWNDLAIGGTSTSSATFHVYGQSQNQGTLAVASVSAHTSFAGLVADNTIGDLFTASSSGLTRFVINQNGNVGINNSNPTATLSVAGPTVTSGNILNVKPNDPSTSLTGNLINVASTDHTYMNLTNQDLTIGGHKNLKSLSNVQKVFVYDTSKDTDGGAWTNDERAQASSWYNETLNTSSRGATKPFPRKAIIAVTSSTTTDVMDIYDAKDNSLWMQFNKSNTAMLGGTSNSTGQTVTALNGKIYFVNTGTSGGVYVVDFKADTSYKYDSTGYSQGINNILNRNAADTYNLYGSINTLLTSNNVNDVAVNVINGNTYLAVANAGSANGDVNLINESTEAKVANFGPNSNASFIALTSTGDLYATIKDPGGTNNYALKAKHNAQKSSGNSVVFDEFYVDQSSSNYGAGTSDGNGAFSTLSPTRSGVASISATFVPTALSVTQGTSTVDGKSNTIYMGAQGSNGSVMALSERQGIPDLGTMKYYTSTYITDDLVSDVRAFWPLDSNVGSGTKDVSVMGNNLTNGLQAPTYTATGVRGQGATLTSSTYASSSASILQQNLNTLIVSGWVKATSVTTTNGTREMWIFGDKPTDTGSTVSFGIGTKGNGTNAYLYCFGGNADGSTLYEANTNIVVQTNVWYHVAEFSPNNNSIDCYVNGQLTAVTQGANFESPTNVGIGKTQHFNSVTGSVDEVEIAGISNINGYASVPNIIAHMYQVGWRASQNHNSPTIRGVAIGTNSQQELANGNSNVSAVAASMQSGQIYVGTNIGGVSAIGMDSDTLNDFYNSNMNTTDDTGSSWSSPNNNAINSISVGQSYGNGMLLSFGSNNGGSGGLWLESQDTTLKDFFATNYNPFGATLDQSNLNVDTLLRVTNQLSTRLDNLAFGATSSAVLADAFRVDNNGNFLSRSLINSTTAMQFQNASGTTILNIDTTNGNVGIGTTSPAAPLEVAGSIYASSFVDRDNSSYFIDPAASGIAGTFNGNVGIGTTSPIANLQVVGSASLSANLTFYGAGTTHAINYDNGGNINFVRSPGGEGGSAASSTLYLANTGNVGIGTTNPDNFLQVYSSGATDSPLMSVTNGTREWTMGINGVSDFFRITDQTAGTARLAITGGTGATGGFVGIGTTGPAFKLDVLSAGANGTTVAQFKNAGATSCTVQPGGTSFACSSDIRLKTNINTISNALSQLQQLRGVTYHWNDLAGGDNGLQYGFIAQEVATVIPTAVSLNSSGYEVLNSNAIIPLTVNAIQELATTVATHSSQLANLSLTQTGDVSLIDASPSADFTIPHYYTLNDMFGNPIKQMGALAELVVGNLRAGSGQFQQLFSNSLAIATDNVSIAGQKLSDYILAVVNNAINNGTLAINSPISSIDQIHTNLISPLASNSAIAVDLTGSKFTIRNNASGSAVASIDNTGNATFSGTLNSQNLAVNADATISGTLHAGKIVANDIEGLSAIVGTLSAQNITNVTNMYFATPSGTPTDGNIAMGQSGFSSTNSAVPAPYLGYTNIASYSGFLAAVPNLNTDTAIVNQNFVSLGATALGDTTITGQLSVGTNLILADSSINVLGQSLEIQPLRQGGVNFEGGLLAIDTDGNLTVNGNAVFSKTLAANIISPISNDRNLNVQLGQNSSATGSALATSNLSVQNASGSGIFSIDQLGNVIASGAASIAKLNLNAVQPALAVSDTEVIATGSAGTTLIKPHQTEVTIDNPLVTSQSLIYITPVGQSSVAPYLLRQVDKTSFTVGIPIQQITNTTFNWLIVN